MKVCAGVPSLFQNLSHNEVFSFAERLGLRDAHRISLATLVSYVVSEVSFALANILAKKQKHLRSLVIIFGVLLSAPADGETS